MPHPRADDILFKLGPYWVRKVDKRPGLYVCWYDADAGRVRRRRLARHPAPGQRGRVYVETLDEAQIEVARLVLTGAPASDASFLAVVLDAYKKDVTDNKPSADPAARAIALAITYMTDERKLKTPRVADFDAAGFAVWSARTLDHSLATIVRNLGVVAAAFAHAGLTTKIITKQSAVAAALEKERAPIREEVPRFIPTDEELARFLDDAGDGRLWRACVVMLATACRPEAALDLTAQQRVREAGVVALNPHGRKQTKKYRPTVREPKALTGWLDLWEEEARAKRREGSTFVDYASVDSLESSITRARGRVDLPGMVAYSFRHKMTTVLRRYRVPEDQVAVQLGHMRPNLRTTGRYGEFAPDYLKKAAAAIDAYFARLDKLCARSLFAPTERTGRNVVNLKGRR